MFYKVINNIVKKKKRKKPDTNSTLSLREGIYAGYQRKAKKKKRRKK